MCEQKAKQDRLSGRGQQDIWMYAVCNYSECEGSVLGYHTREGCDVSQGFRPERLLVLYSSGCRCRKPTLFFFLWSSRESRSSASSPWISETCFSFSDNLINNNITIHYEHYHVVKSPLKWKRVKKKMYVMCYGMQHYSRCKKLWAWHCCVGLLLGGEKTQLELGLTENVVSYDPHNKNQKIKL